MASQRGSWAVEIDWVSKESRLNSSAVIVGVTAMVSQRGCWAVIIDWVSQVSRLNDGSAKFDCVLIFYSRRDWLSVMKNWFHCRSSSLFLSLRYRSSSSFLSLRYRSSSSFHSLEYRSWSSFHSLQNRSWSSFHSLQYRSWSSFRRYRFDIVNRVPDDYWFNGMRAVISPVPKLLLKSLDICVYLLSESKLKLDLNCNNALT